MVWLAICAIALLVVRLTIGWLRPLVSNFTGNRRARSLTGPFNLPFVGYLPFITKMPHLKFKLLSEKYGPVFRIYLGNTETIVLNDFRSISEAFKKEEFLGRPPNIAFNVLINLEGLGTLSGNRWKEQKRFTMHQMRNLGFGKLSIEQDIIANIGKVIDRLEHASPQRVSAGELFGVKHFSIGNLLFGPGTEHTDKTYCGLQASIANAIRSLGQVSFLTFFPEITKLLAHFKVVPFINKLKSNFVTVHSYVLSEIDRHEQTLDENGVRDYIDSFLLECRKPRANRNGSTFTRQMLAGNVQGFLAAGIETVRNSLQWALLALAAHRDVQQRVFEEIICVCGNKTPSWSNRATLVYTQAVIWEIERWKTISPLNLMRMTMERTTLNGLVIPKGAHVIANLWAVHFDPDYWHNPAQFNPERFISSIDGQLIKHQRFVPFSLGKRSCPGESLAQMEIFLFVTHLVLKYKILLAESNSFEEVLGLTLQPKQPVILKFEKRSQ